MDNKNLKSSNFKEYSVTELSNALKKTIEVNFDIIHVRGEISSLTVARSGHTYFSLKDDVNVIQVAMWARITQSVNLKLEDGMEVIVIGKVSTYAPQSKYNIIVSSIELAGEGALLKLIEDRRRRLAEEGLFDEKYKKSLPYLPNTIGVITSESGAAFQDIIIRIKERFPTNILLFPVLVQGTEAPKQIVEAIKKINMYSSNNNDCVNLLIVGRGGGSFEDLMAFNEEIVVRAIFESKIPIISAVGHEVDNSIADYVADKRAPTPTAAAEMALPDKITLITMLDSLAGRLLVAIKNKIDLNIGYLNKYVLPQSSIFFDTKIIMMDIINEKLKNKTNFLFEQYSNRIVKNNIDYFSPNKYCLNQENNLSGVIKLLVSSYKSILKSKISDFYKLSEALDLLSYNRVLERGFVLIKDKENKTIKRAKNISQDTQASIKFYDGTVNAILNKKDEN
tara:strand:+ start:31039 stop:32391 length:1353 start_codon:yes stop_codon:yes gene_type:complete